MERIEAQIRDALSNTTITTHMEPIEDPVSWRDAQLEPVGMRNASATVTPTVGQDASH
jgi:hypothetical protein